VAAWLRQAKNPTADEVASYLERGELWGPTKENEELPVTPKLPVGWLYLPAAWLHQAKNPTADEVASYLERGELWGPTTEDKALPVTPRLPVGMAVCAPDGLRWPFAGCALLYLARQDVERGRHRALVAIDAGRVHHGLVSGWRDLPKHRGAEVHGAATIKVKEGFRLELWAPDRRPVQLLLPIEDPTGGIHDAVVRQLRDIANWEGLRNWAAWLRLLSVEGGRQGWVRWTVDAHLAALNTRKCTPEAKERVARIVELFTKLELAVIGPDGRTRERRPLVLVGQRREVKVNSQWRLDGMELQMNPLLYSGVRNQETKRLGCNWWPASPELPQIDHIRHPYACALGLLLPIRFRWDYGDGRDHTTLKGRNLLETAGIAFDKNTPDRAWKVLARDLDELKRIGELRRWEWDTGAPGLDAMCNIYPPPRALDIIKRGLLPERTAPTPSILTGGELREWRQRHGWTQGQTARELGVHPRTIMRAELNPDRRLGPALRAAVRRTLPPGER
jgi:DNA-binding XRE family transcriptional regulator